MKPVYLTLAFAFLLQLAADEAKAQVYGQIQMQPQVVYQQPVYQQAVAVPSQSVQSVCQCNPTTPGDCKCKGLDCKIKLPYSCKKKTPIYKTPSPSEIFGKIPKMTEEVNCHSKICDFTYKTDVPQIYCMTEKCIEIGKKVLQCIPGCCFEVCIPAFTCKSESVECRLVQKLMNMELWQRNDNGRIVYDVFVINVRDPNSPFYAGGMPAKWVIMECGTIDQLRARFPNAVRSDGKALVKSAKGAKPQATKADVDITMIIDKEKIEAHYRAEQKAISKKSAPKDHQAKADQKGARATEKAVARKG